MNIFANILFFLCASIAEITLARANEIVTITCVNEKTPKIKFTSILDLANLTRKSYAEKNFASQSSGKLSLKGTQVFITSSEELLNQLPPELRESLQAHPSYFDRKDLGLYLWDKTKNTYALSESKCSIDAGFVPPKPVIMPDSDKIAMSCKMIDTHDSPNFLSSEVGLSDLKVLSTDGKIPLIAFYVDKAKHLISFKILIDGKEDLENERAMGYTIAIESYVSDCVSRGDFHEAPSNEKAIYINFCSGVIWDRDIPKGAVTPFSKDCTKIDFDSSVFKLKF